MLPESLLGNTRRSAAIRRRAVGEVTGDDQDGDHRVNGNGEMLTPNGIYPMRNFWVLAIQLVPCLPTHLGLLQLRRLAQVDIIPMVASVT